MKKLLCIISKVLLLILAIVSCTQNKNLLKNERFHDTRNLYLKFDTTINNNDTMVLIDKIKDFNFENKRGDLYCFFYGNPPQKFRFTRLFYTPNQNKYEIINEDKVLDYNPINIYDLAKILKKNKTESLTEYFENFQNVYIIEMNQPEKKAKVVKVKQYLGDFTNLDDN